MWLGENEAMNATLKPAKSSFDDVPPLPTTLTAVPHKTKASDGTRANPGVRGGCLRGG